MLCDAPTSIEDVDSFDVGYVIFLPGTKYLIRLPPTSFPDFAVGSGILLDTENQELMKLTLSSMAAP